MKKTYWQEVHEQCAEKDNMRLKTNKYRCEQTIITKLNGVPACTIRTKSDYQFEWVENLKRPAMNAYCKLLEQFVSVYPPSYQKPLEMIIDLEKLKFESVFDIDMATGKMAVLSITMRLLRNGRSIRRTCWIITVSFGQLIQKRM